MSESLTSIEDIASKNTYGFVHTFSSDVFCKWRTVAWTSARSSLVAFSWPVWRNARRELRWSWSVCWRNRQDQPTGGISHIRGTVQHCTGQYCLVVCSMYRIVVGSHGGYLIIWTQTVPFKFFPANPNITQHLTPSYPPCMSALLFISHKISRSPLSSVQYPPVVTIIWNLKILTCIIMAIFQREHDSMLSENDSLICFQTKQYTILIPIG